MKKLLTHHITLLLIVFAALLTTLIVTGGSFHRTTQKQYHTPYGVTAHPTNWGQPPKHLFQVVRPNKNTVEMFDTVTLNTVPSNPRVLAGYTAGYWPTYLPLVHRYPGAKVKSIAIASRYNAQCLDVEPGDATPSQVVSWYYADKRAGFKKPCIYGSYFEWKDQIYPTLNAAHIARTSYSAWDADYTYYPHIDSGFDGTQWTDHAYGRNLDESTITRSFAGLVVTPPKPKPVPTPKPSPIDHARLLELKAQREAIRKHLLVAGCRVTHPKKVEGCARLAAHGARVNRRIKLLEAKGA